MAMDTAALVIQKLGVAGLDNVHIHVYYGAPLANDGNGQAMDSQSTCAGETCKSLLSREFGNHWVAQFDYTARAKHATALERLTIMCCSILAFLPDGLENLLVLESLTILSCPELAISSRRRSTYDVATKSGNSYLSKTHGAAKEGIGQLSELQHLSIQDCPEHVKQCKREEGVDWPEISHTS
ncbi:hypothetical protein V6N12_070730 [Hibiscus sabdariffa]|uniref:Uncharacterized protein n=1 Tax=Hibiscus sabdariffa TaxID=183260 RepID=A0ABR2FHV7_9ROSI